MSFSLSPEFAFPSVPVVLCSSGLVEMGISWTDGSCGGPGCSQDAGYYLGFCQLLSLCYMCAGELLSGTLKES